MKYFIFQGNDHDCGFASLKMLLAHVARDKSYLFIPKPVKREGYSVDDLVKIANEYDFKLESFGCDDNYYVKMKTPCLTLIDKNHVIMVKKVDKKHITFYDPAYGKTKLKRDNFLARWRQIVIEISDDTKPRKIPKYRQEILPKKMKIFDTIISSVSVAILVGTFYLLNDTLNAIFSLVILGLFATFQIIENFLIHREIYHFDKSYISPFFYQVKNQNKLSYYEFIEFKRKYFSLNRNLLSSVLIAILITFLLCLNDFKNLFVLLALILVKILDNVLFGRVEEKKKKEIAEYEEKCFDGKGRTVEYATKANNLANLLVSQNSMKQIFYMFLSFALALVMMITTGNSGCNYVIFHFLLYYFGANSISSVLLSLSNRKEVKKEEQRFLDSCNL